MLVCLLSPLRFFYYALLLPTVEDKAVMRCDETVFDNNVIPFSYFSIRVVLQF